MTQLRCTKCRNWHWLVGLCPWINWKSFFKNTYLHMVVSFWFGPPTQMWFSSCFFFNSYKIRLCLLLITVVSILTQNDSSRATQWVSWSRRDLNPDFLVQTQLSKNQTYKREMGDPLIYQGLRVREERILPQEVWNSCSFCVQLSIIWKGPRQVKWAVCNPQSTMKDH